MDGDELSSHSVTFMSEEEEQHVDYQEQSLIENYTEMHHVKAHTRDFDQIHDAEYMAAYRDSLDLTIIFVILCIVSLGTLLLLVKWFPHIRVYLTHWKSTFDKCTTVLVKCKNNGAIEVCPVSEELVMQSPDSNRTGKVRIMSFRRKCYIYNPRINAFVPRVLFDQSLTIAGALEETQNGADLNTRIIRKLFYGENSTDIPMKNLFFLLVDEVIHPFYLFQLFSVVLWLVDGYYLFAATIIISSIVSVVTNLLETRKNLQNLQEMSSNSHINVHTHFNNTRKNVPSLKLIPGDIVEIEEDAVLTCDMLLVSGHCLIDESLLTGESVPVIKTSIAESNTADEYFDIEGCKSNTLFSGTKVIHVTGDKSNQKTLAMVLRTGFDTSRGKILLSILYPKDNHFTFYRDSFIFIGIMSLFGIAGMIYSIITLHKFGVSKFTLIIRALDIITIVVPPALPMAMTVGTSFAIWRLKLKNIFCISPHKVNVSGKLTCVCFDKTGTLTDTGVTLVGAWPNAFPTYELVRANALSQSLTKATNGDLFTYAIATCHSLSYMRQDLVGDTMELEMFNYLKWVLKEPSLDNAHTTVSPSEVVFEGSRSWNDTGKLMELEIIHRFDFSSALQRMSVIARDCITGKHYVFMKGSPEIVSSLSNAFTIASNYNETLEQYVTRGYRVLAYSYKEISENEIDQARNVLEFDLNFLGLVVLQNNLKRDTVSTIDELRVAGFEKIMVTGDNSLTAVAVALQCGIIEPDKKVIVSEVTKWDDKGNAVSIEWKEKASHTTYGTEHLLSQNNLDDIELVVTGAVFDYLLTQHKMHNHKERTSWLHQILMLCHVYARMSPNQKLLLSEELQHVDYYVGFCGDGVNDSGALKASHVGVSLSESETGISAPFTSLNTTIRCIPILIREGRAALALSFQLFKYMSAYSFIQFSAVVLLYRFNSVLADSQFLYVDMGLILPTVLLMSYTEPVDHLVHTKPSGSLITAVTFLSLFIQLGVSFAFQMFILFYLKRQPWFTYIDPANGMVTERMETTAIFIITCFQTLGSSLAYSISKPFKKPLYTNIPYMTTIIVLFCTTVYLAFTPDRFTRQLFKLVEMPREFQAQIVVFGMIQVFIFYLVEYVFVASAGRKLLRKIDFRKMYYKKKYRVLKKKMGLSHHHCSIHSTKNQLQY